MYNSLGEGFWEGVSEPLPEKFFQIAFSYWCILVANKCTNTKTQFEKKYWGGPGLTEPSPAGPFGHLSRKYNISVRTVRIHESLQHSQVP